MSLKLPLIWNGGFEKRLAPMAYKFFGKKYAGGCINLKETNLFFG